MQYRYLGNTNLQVSQLCFGSLTIGPLQKNLPVQDGAAVIRYALDQGVNFIDTAELYGTYPYIREALKSGNSEVIIASKSYAYTAEAMRDSLETARKELDRDVIEIFLLHEQENPLTLQGHQPALAYLVDAKARGLIKAIGISTHSVAAVWAALKIPEIEVIHPLFNLRGVGIQGGTREDMLLAIQAAYLRGLGIYGMKPIGGGNLLFEASAALNYAFSLPQLHAVAVGMQSILEVEVNIVLAEGRTPKPGWDRDLGAVPRTLHIDHWCQGCGQCVEKCGQGALSLKGSNGQMIAQVDPKHCILCGYCGASCPEFCIKII